MYLRSAPVRDQYQYPTGPFVWFRFCCSSVQPTYTTKALVSAAMWLVPLGGVRADGDISVFFGQFTGNNSSLVSYQNVAS